MQAPIAQAVALTIAGNRFLQGGDLAGFWPDASVFRHCARVAFVTLSGPDAAPVATPYADHPLAWLQKLQGEGRSGLRLLYAPSQGTQRDRELAGFAGGGGRRFIAAVAGDKADLWEARWAVGDRKDPAQKIWIVTYGRVATDFDLADEAEREPPAIRADLAETLAAITQFADAQQLTNFAASFREASERLESAAPLTGSWFETLAHEGSLGLAARQLLGAAEAPGSLAPWAPGTISPSRARPARPMTSCPTVFSCW
ncbi:hypothetical protein FRZ61_25540 [Hypericibacter adhaerens]|uniref:Uncharacterized protein n=1 Tax=Hypericibacter adhaerens TaxID=2602016 RepID=A0A5J6MY03_9PROT|nr:hypothetical protein [Hypericibacter adhaerens]QEX22622.1 hypothetical protein FRZ61_25540 [Hypericibacter adhaerens]